MFAEAHLYFKEPPLPFIFVPAPPPTPPPDTPSPYIPWYSCPQGLFWVDGVPYWVTLDNNTPYSTFTISTIDPDTGEWIIIYSTTAVNDSLNDPDDVSYNWAEPDIGIESNGTITVIGVLKPYNAGGGNYPWQIDLFVFSKDVFVNKTSIVTGDYGTIMGQVYTSDWIFIDSLGTIHVLVLTYTSGVSPIQVYDFQSTDDGATYTPVQVNSTGLSTNVLGKGRYIQQEANGDIWINLYSGNIQYKSTDGGATWSAVSVIGLGYAIRDQKILNDVHFAIGESAFYDFVISRSTDGLTFTTVLEVDNPANSPRLYCAALAYDGTYYYGIFNIRDGAAAYPNPAGRNDVYRSSNGIDWVLVATFRDTSELAPGLITTANLEYDSTTETLAYTYYYAETDFDDSVDSAKMLTYWTSTDHGITWVAVQTPFFDLSTSGAPTGSKFTITDNFSTNLNYWGIDGDWEIIGGVAQNDNDGADNQYPSTIIYFRPTYFSDQYIEVKVINPTSDLYDAFSFVLRSDSNGGNALSLQYDANMNGNSHKWYLLDNNWNVISDLFDYPMVANHYYGAEITGNPIVTVVKLYDNGLTSLARGAWGSPIKTWNVNLTSGTYGKYVGVGVCHTVFSTFQLDDFKAGDI
jgi:hypothetical protein